MLPLPNILFFISLLLLIDLKPIQAQTTTNLRTQDSLALVSLYNSTNGDEWRRRDNWLSTPLEDWHGVGVSQGRVTSLTLTKDSLRGTLPAELGDLTALTYLDLSDNQIRGSIPASLGNLTRLSRLYLHRNQLSGEIPASIGSLEELVELFLFRNQLNGDIPASLGNLTELRELWLFINELTGEIPEELGELTNLNTLWISDNQLSGFLPATLGSLENLTKLFVYRNLLTGSLPVELGRLENLSELRLYGNFLTGRIPEELNGLDNLERVSVHDNLFSFDDLLPSLNQSYEFYYNPQRVSEETETIALSSGDDYTIALRIDEEISGNTYRWYQNHRFVTETTEPRLNLTDVDETQAGVYHSVVTNAAIEDFSLLMRSQFISVGDVLPCPSSRLTAGTYRAESQSQESEESYEDVLVYPTSADSWNIAGFEREFSITDSCATLVVQEASQYGYPVLLKESDDVFTLYWLKDFSSEQSTSLTVLTITTFTLVTPGAIVADAGEDVALSLQNDDQSQTITLSGSGSSTFGEVVSDNFVWTQDGEVVGVGPQINVTLEEGSYTFTLTITDARGNTAQDQVAILVQPKRDIEPEEDRIAPTIIRNDSPSAYDLASNQDLTFALVAEDNQAITEYSLFYAGLTTPDFQANQISAPLTVADGTYRFSLSSTTLAELNDPLGIRYTFVLQDAAGNRTTETDATYRVYPDQTFGANDPRVGPWRAVAQPAAPTVSDYNIIALPFDPQPVQTVLAALGRPDPTQWRLFAYSNNNGQTNFQEYGSPGFTVGSDFNPKWGYFLIMRNNDDIDFGGQIAEMQRKDDAYVHPLILQPGWNLIGNPFPFTLDWEKVRADSLNKGTGSLPPLNRLGVGDDDYVATLTLSAFEGAFVYWPGNTNRTVYLTPSPAGNSTGRQDTATPDKGWELALVLEQGNFRSNRAGVGMRTTASEDLDPYDLLSVPKPLTQPELVIEHSSLPLNRSVVPEQSSYTWSAHVKGVVPSEEVSLHWDRSLASALPQELYLWDARQAQLVDMKSQGSYRFTASSQDPSWQIYYGSDERLWEVLPVSNTTVGFPYPNPAQNIVTLPVILPTQNQRNANVVVSFTDPGGQVIARYVFSSLPVGYNALEVDVTHWPAGLYHYQLRVQDRHSAVFTGKVMKR